MIGFRPNDVLLLGGARTPIGAFLGSLSSLSATELGSLAIRAAIERTQIDPMQVDEVVLGNVLSAGLGQAPAKQAALGGGVPNHVPCTTVNKVCGSGMKSAMMVGQSILLGENQVAIAGGMESMSNAPYLLKKARTGYRMGHSELIDSMILDGLWDPYGECHMGICADSTALEENFSRESLDRFASESYARALRAIDAGRLAEEITPVEVSQRKGPPLLVKDDEEPSKGDPTKLAGLKPAFQKDGTTTAGNASSLNDGACALVVCSGRFASSHPLEPVARLVGWSSFAQEPQRFTTAPSGAVKKLLNRHSLSVAEIDLFEINEAFSVVAMSAAASLGIPDDKMNVNGGAVALGHPIGMSGARLLLTAALELRRRGGRYAVASPCIGGGEATAVLIENLTG